LGERVVRETTCIATNGDTLGKLKLQLTFISPFEFTAFIFFTNKNKVGVTISKLILLTLSRVQPWVRAFGFRAHSDEFDVFAKAELLNTA